MMFKHNEMVNQLIDLTHFGEARKVKKAVFQEAFLCNLVSNREVGSMLKYHTKTRIQWHNVRHCCPCTAGGHCFREKLCQGGEKL